MDPILRATRPLLPAVARALAAILILAVLLAACGSPVQTPLAAPPAVAGPFSLTIVHSSDTWGYVDPCG